MDAAFDYLLDLSMSMSMYDTDRDALREAHHTLLSMDADCRVPAASVLVAGAHSSDFAAR